MTFDLIPMENGYDLRGKVLEGGWAALRARFAPILSPGEMSALRCAYQRGALRMLSACLPLIYGQASDVERDRAVERLMAEIDYVQPPGDDAA
jgi:hypothetical protein